MHTEECQIAIEPMAGQSGLLVERRLAAALHQGGQDLRGSPAVYFADFNEPELARSLRSRLVVLHRFADTLVRAAEGRAGPGTLGEVMALGEEARVLIAGMATPASEEVRRALARLHTRLDRAGPDPALLDALLADKVALPALIDGLRGLGPDMLRRVCSRRPGRTGCAVAEHERNALMEILNGFMERLGELRLACSIACGA